MAVGAAVAQATVTTKISLGRSRAKYIGTVAFGNEYATGGDTLESNPEGRYTLPEKLDSLQITGASGWDFQYVPGATPKVQVIGTGAAAKGAGAEAAAKTDLSALSAVTFEAIGPR
jgi:hypothetical protein